MQSLFCLSSRHRYTVKSSRLGTLKSARKTHDSPHDPSVSTDAELAAEIPLRISPGINLPIYFCIFSNYKLEAANVDVGLDF